MSTSVADEILGEALKQTETDRARLAEALIASLDGPADRKIEHERFVNQPFSRVSRIS